MNLSLGLHGWQKLPVKAIAARLRMTPSAITQRALKIQKHLDMFHEGEGI